MGFGQILQGAIEGLTRDPIATATAVNILTGRGQAPMQSGGFQLFPMMGTPAPSFGPRLAPPMATPANFPFGGPDTGILSGIPDFLESSIGAPTLFRQTAGGGVRAVSMFRAQNPATGRDVWFRNAGRPVLWSGDIAATKRVSKAARRARRARPR